MRMQDVLAVILGGGVGSRLYPLTKERAKPAVPLAGKYRLIDIPMSNCFHAGIDKVAILTQFKSVSLHRHIHRTYNRDIFTPGWVQILAAEQSHGSGEWYQGTADAIRKQVVEIREANTEVTLILAGDHLYRMDYRDFVQQHADSGADVTIAVQPVSREAASALGILKMDDRGEITAFTEKPQSDEALAGFESGSDATKPYMASMGIYIFGTETLLQMLDELPGTDFGRHIIPAVIDSHTVMGYVFDGYWEDIGTIRRFYEVNLNMASPLPKFNLYDPKRPIYTRPRFLPGSKVEGGSLHNVLLADGGRIQEATLRNSVIGLRSIIGHGVSIQRTIIMGADYYESQEDREHNRRMGRPDVGIGPNSFIEGAIIDKNARIGQGVIVRHRPDREDEDGDDWVSRDGIVIIPKNAVIPRGTVI
ncbi:MAG TPA: glucose-1-phosphate adenylyltransferase [Candidatus Sulfomarinibacteraceae bacterium]|nr:glucose-1-phosphate adenylyltransferase [Candidatus Sulfomarinibacteraceae bacterium]